MSERIRVLRVIARMNAGGPAHHVGLLSGRLDSKGYETLLVSGEIGPGEATMEDFAEEQGARLVKIRQLGPEVRPIADLRALFALVRIVRSFRPHIVHTHTAKAGFVGRLAACAVRPRPVVVHTYHGHVLEGYFGRLRTAVFRYLEWGMARVTDTLIGVSQATVDDLVRLRVAARERFRVVPVGLELDSFADLSPERGAAFRRLVSASPDDVVLTYVGRLVPIKRLELAIDALARARREGSPVRLVLVGDGPRRRPLELHARRMGVAEATTFTGYRKDLEAVIAGTDVAVLTSANEGTPVFLIQAAAGQRPAVASDVGGVSDVVTPETGRLVPPDDTTAMATALSALASDPALRRELGAHAAKHVRTRFSTDRLLADMDALYRELLNR